MQLQLNHTIGLVLLDDDQKEDTHVQLSKYLSCFGSHKPPGTVSQKEILQMLNFHIQVSSSDLSELIQILAESFS